MSGTTVTLRPNGDVSVAGWAIFGAILGVPPATVSAATNHNNGDTPGVSGAAGVSMATLDVTNPVLPALAKVLTVTPRAFAYANAGGASATGILSLATERAGITDASDLLPLTGIPTMVSGRARTSPPGNGLWADVLAETQFRFGNAGSDYIAVSELFLDVLYNEAPVVTVTAPSGVTATSKPVVHFTYSDPEGDAQESYRVAVFEKLVVDAPGFDPATSPAVWRVGEFGTVTQATVVTALGNGVTYRAYVQAADVGSGGRYGAWAQGPEFTVTVAAPAGPMVTAVPDVTHGRVRVTVQGRDNALQEGSADFEFASGGNTGGNWQAETNCTIPLSSADSVNGSWSLAMTSVAAGTMIAGIGTDGTVQVAPGALVTLHAAVKIPTGRTAKLRASWRDAASGFIRDDDGPVYAGITGVWLRPRAVLVAPANARYCNLHLVTAGATGAGEVHRIDTAGIAPGYLNLLTDGQSTFEAAATFTTVHCTLDRPVANPPVQQDGRVLRVTATANGDATLATPAGTSAFAVSVGDTLTVGGRWTVESGLSRVISVWVEYYDASGVSIGTSTPATALVSGSRWTTLLDHPKVPAGAVTAQVHHKIASATTGELFRADCMPFQSGASSDFSPPGGWTPGGRVGATTTVLERSTDSGVTWVTVRGGDGAALPVGSQQLIVDDYEAPIGIGVMYRARVTAIVAAAPLASGFSDNVPALLVAATGGWLKDLSDPTRNLAVCVPLGLQSVAAPSDFVTRPIGRSTYVVVGDGTGGAERYQLGFVFDTDAAYQAFETLRASARTLLLQTGFGDGTAAAEQAYVRLAGTRNMTRDITDTGRGVAVRRVTVDAYAVPAP